MRQTNDPRVERMYQGDRGWAYFSLLILWATLLFVFYAMLPIAGDDGVLLALAISGGMVLLFNTASIIAMLSHYSNDKEHIYGLDLYYQDAAKKTAG